MPPTAEPRRRWKGAVLRKVAINSRVTRWILEWAETSLGTFTLVAQPDELVTDVFAPHGEMDGDFDPEETERYNFQEPGKGVWLRIPASTALYYPLNLTKFTLEELLAARSVVDAAFDLAETTVRFRDLYAKDHAEMERNYRRSVNHMRRNPENGELEKVEHHG
jgi:hypothetical protein